MSANSSQTIETISHMMRPRSVAIIGVSSKAGTAGRNMAEILKLNAFAGDIYYVGRNGGELDGRKIHTNIDELPEGIDLAVFTLPAAGIVEGVEGAVRRKIRTGVIFASGFAEMGDNEREAQTKIGEVARKGGLSFVGPNCLGYSNHSTGFGVGFVVAHKTEKLDPSIKSAAAVLSQSGGIGGHMKQSLEFRGVPASYWITTGNEGDLTIAEFLEYLVADERTNLICMYVEQVRRPAEFLAAARKARDAGKPIVMIHPGRSDRGKVAAQSHTGALTGDYAVMKTLLEDAGVILCNTLDEVTDVAEILARNPKPSPGGLGVVTFSGAFCGIAYDFAEDLGINIPNLSADAEAYLKPQLPHFLPPKNPVDLGTQAAVEPHLVGEATKALLNDPGVGAVALSFSPGPPVLSLKYMDGIVKAMKSSPAKPISLNLLGDTAPVAPEVQQFIEANGISSNRSPDRLMRAMAQVVHYGNRPKPSPAPAARKFDLPKLGSGTQAEWLGKKVFAAAGIKVPAGELATSADEAVKIAARIGYPVAMKAQAAKLAHKTEAGGVLLSIADEAGVRAAYKKLEENIARAAPGIKLDGVLVEVMGKKGIELMIGARRDPQWGPVTLVGLGGIWVEALGDVRLLPPTMPENRIVEELMKLRTAKLLKGFRGQPAADVEAVAKVAATIGQLMLAVPEIVEIDVNPLVVYGQGEGAIALDALIVTK